MNTTFDDGFGENLPNSITTDSTMHFHHSTLDIESEVVLEKIEVDSLPNMIQPTTKPNQLTIIPTEETEDMQNHLIFERNLKYFHYFGAMIGVQMIFDWKPAVMFASSLFQVFIITSQLTYTQYLHIKHHDYQRILETLAVYGITISMMLKIWAFLSGFKELTALYNSTIALCKINSTGCRGIKVRDRLSSNSKFYTVTTVFIIQSILIFLAYPIKAFVADNEHLSLIPIEYMFVDLSTLSGFITANVISSLMGVTANVATAYTILIFEATILNYSVLVDLFEEDVKYLDEMWSGTSDTSITFRHTFLRNMCRKQQDMNAYIEKVKIFSDEYFFLYFIASYLGQIICLFQIVVSDWKSGYAIAYGMFLEMMFYCLMGTKLSSDNERVCSALQQSNWYSYDAFSQKTFLTLYIASANSKEMRIGLLAPLSVFTGTNVIKSIFTYYNIMLEVV